MKKYLFILFMTLSAKPLFAQYVYTINADSVKITNHCDTAELIIENHTQTVPGFLFNKGRGRTEFRRGMITIDDSLYIIGEDTLNLSNGLKALTASNGLQRIGNDFQFGNDDNDPYFPAYQNRNTYYYQNGSFFNWMTGFSNMFTVSHFQYPNVPESNVLSAYYLARFYNPQGGLLMEGNVKTAFNGPLAWINFKNDHPDNVSSSFFGDPISASINCLAVTGTNSKIYHEFFFSLPNDTPRVASGTVLRLSPTHVFPFGSVKIPTASTTRLVVQDNISGCANCIGPVDANNLYSSLVVDARNQPVVFGNLPSSSTGNTLIIDADGRIWKGPVVSGGSSLSAATLATSDQPAGKSTITPAGTSNEALLKKIESLSLFVIEQGREIQSLKEELAELKKANKK
ncbi:MAG: hypothetical protein JST39_21920 [Bacteroidetes bacterium]|nr:hypothetical protein [Bacteroidota bacterium]